MLLDWRTHLNPPIKPTWYQNIAMVNICENSDGDFETYWKKQQKRIPEE